MAARRQICDVLTLGSCSFPCLNGGNGHAEVKEDGDTEVINIYWQQLSVPESNTGSKMPHIDNDIKLDFKDVLLRPKRSTLKSRSEHLEQVLEAVPQIRYICLDVANGYSEHFVQFLRDLRKRFPDHTIMVRAGADFVMVGGMLAGHTESGGDLIEKEGKKYKLFYGMSSEVSMKKYAGGVAEYRASEGKVVEVPFKGDVEHTLRDILGGIRSTCTYVGAAKLKELSRRTTFIRVTQQVNPIFGAEDQP
ncbi:hypothetical protein E2320_003628 [Naja naja]|nr:hypothetical protein E2320_003628 [Naja naja]